jgi:hypothetical protein
LPTRRFEGASLDDVLRDVQNEIGADARIIEANKLRAGGIGGFFAKERFEVVVELDDEPKPAAKPRPRRERPLGAASRQADADAAPADNLLALADEVSALERTAATRVSTQGTDFADILGRIARDAGVPVQDDGGPEIDIREVKPAPTFEALYEAPTPEPARDLAPQGPIPAQGPVTPPAPAQPARDLALYGPDPAQHAPVVVTTPAAAPAPVELVRTGLPAQMLAAVEPGTDVAVALAQCLSTLPAPTPLPRSKGSVVAVVGDRESAMAIARDVAEEHDVDPATIVLASSSYRGKDIPEDQRIGSPDEAFDRRRSWGRRRHATIVAIEAPIDDYRRRWASDVLDALEPSATWGVVDARRKAEDVAAWVDDLGGVDAIALEATHATVSPASILELDIPVARIDGRAATPALWTALLVERLSA